MIAPTSILVLAVLATAQRPVGTRPVAPRPVDPRAVVPTVVVPTPVAPGAQVSSFQGTWLGGGSDSTTRRMVRVEGLHIRVSEGCLPSGDGQCDYEGDAVAYHPLSAAPNDSTVSALAVEYGDTQWRQSLILRQPERGRLEAFVYTRFTESAKRRNLYEHQLLMPVAFHALPPRIPQFPWPPPRPTVTLRLPDSLVAIPGHDSLGSVFDRLRVALTRVDVGWWSVYAIGSNGFAVVTRMEAIDAEGRPKPGAERWSGPGTQETPHFSGIGDYLTALFSARPGFYRVIVFAVTDLPSGPTADGHGLSAAHAEALVAGGTDQLPAEMRRVRLGADGRCIALIYEFERPSQSDSARFVYSVAIGALQHLTLAGLWTEAQLRK